MARLAVPTLSVPGSPGTLFSCTTPQSSSLQVWHSVAEVLSPRDLSLEQQQTPAIMTGIAQEQLMVEVVRAVIIGE